MKNNLQKLVFLFAAVILTLNAKAQNNVWNSIKDVDGVSVSWRYRMELKDQYICEMKFVNNNSYKVSISFKAHFVCANGHEFLSHGETVKVNANDKKGGQWDGLSYYPCENATEPPTDGGYRDLVIKQIN